MDAKVPLDPKALDEKALVAALAACDAAVSASNLEEADPEDYATHVRVAHLVAGITAYLAALPPVALPSRSSVEAAVLPFLRACAVNWDHDASDPMHNASNSDCRVCWAERLLTLLALIPTEN